MSSSGDDYFVSRQKQIERKKMILTIVGVGSFLGSTIFGVVNLIQQPQQSQPKNISIEQTLKQQAQGYELVLQREPNNQVALEKLSIARLHLKDTKGAIALMEKLVKLHPERKDYKVVLEQVKKQQGNSDR